MEDILKEKICSICKNFNTENCKKNIVQRQINPTLKSISCLNYIKNPKKIKAYEKSLVVTAKRCYVNDIER